MKTKLYLSLIVITSFFGACNSNQNSGGHTHDTVGGNEEHDENGHEAGALGYTMF
nr:hypothetical protein [Sunxiuqinia sp.]